MNEELEPSMGIKEVTTAMEKLNDELDIYRNEIIEEVAVSIEKFTVPFGEDTIMSFATYIRGMKK